MVKVINPTNADGTKFTNPKEYWNENKPIIFLAGPCPRADYTDDWRFEAIGYLEQAGFDGIVFNPTNPKYNTSDPDYLTKQTQWEVEAMNCSNKVIFWIPRDEEHPAFTTNIELGAFLNIDRVNEFEIGWPETAIKNDYIQVRLNMIDKKRYSDLKELVS